MEKKEYNLKLDLKNLNEKNPNEILEIIKKKFDNGWILNICEKYSEDYPHLTHNWNLLCESVKENPQKIILVSDIDSEGKMAVSEFLTRKGFLIRLKKDFVICSKCGALIPCEDLYNLAKNNSSFKLPSLWSENCINC